MFRSLDRMPIWNWYHLHKTNDLKYLVKDHDYTLPLYVTGKLYLKLKQQYRDLLAQLDKVDFTLIHARQQFQIKLMELVKQIAQSSTDPVKLDKAYYITLAMMATDDPKVEWLFSVDFTETPDQRAYLTEIARAIHQYNNKRGQRRKEQTLNERTVKIERELGVKIDVFTCSVTMFKEYENQAIEKLTWQQANK